MKTVVEALAIFFMRFLLFFRYRITFKGLDNIDKKNPGGMLFLPNHPAVFIDPVTVIIGIHKKVYVRPMAVEYMYYTPFIYSFMKLVKAVPVPDFATSSNSIKKKRTDKVFQEMIEGLKKGDNFAIYPAGKTKGSAKEVLGGASGIHKILSDLPDTNIVLVRVKGLWGSKFSRFWTGRAAKMFPVIKWGFFQILKNFIFFMPKRHITIVFEPLPKDFPRHGTKIEMNRFLEHWYNLPDGLTQQEGDQPGDSLMLIPYSFWSSKTPEREYIAKQETSYDISTIPVAIQDAVIDKITDLTDIPSTKIKPEMTIASDLGIDSLDTAELIAFLGEKFEIKNVPVEELTTVGKVMAIAAGQVPLEDTEVDFNFDLSKWKRNVKKERAYLAPGETIPEAFLNACSKWGSKMAIADDRLGPINYKDLKLRTIILAQSIKHLPGESIGILLPASCAAFMCILACQMAGKIPVMINWTQGPRHLEQVKELSKLQSVLSSWAFIDRLEGVDFNGLDDLMIMLEDIKRSVSLKDKIKGKWLSYKKNEAILKTLNPKGSNKDDTCVLLFTSGTENMPKGVPLSHFNILENQRPVLNDVEIFTDDILFGILPPFHSFGFTISTLLAPLGGIKVAFYPKPTESKALAERAEKWGITIMCGAPTFLKGMLKAGTKEQLKTMRLCVTGAEKAPPELFKMFDDISHGDILEGYGITECSPVLTMNRTGVPHKEVGQPMAGVELLIVNQETLAPVPKNTTGLILARGPCIFKGYINPGIESPFVEVEGKKWYKTGDLGFLDDENFLTISGRVKRFIKIGGEMLSLSAIEDALVKAAPKMNWKFLEEAPSLAILAKEVAGEKTKIMLYTAFATDVEQVNRVLKEAGFSNLIRVSQLTVLKEIPIMGTGKINYRALEKIHA